jgi:aldose sugar dehydrogenase
VLHVVSPAMDSQAHYGSRIVFADGHVFVSLGDRNQKDFGPDHIAQDLSSENGSVMRLTLDGEIPDDNPFVDQEGAAGAIWSYGHRNIQAMAQSPGDGRDLACRTRRGRRRRDQHRPARRELRLAAGGLWGGLPHGRAVRRHAARPATVSSRRSSTGRRGATITSRPRAWPGTTGRPSPTGRGTCWSATSITNTSASSPSTGREVSAPTRLLEGEGWRIRDVAVGPEDGYIYVIVDDESAPLSAPGAGGRG